MSGRRTPPGRRSPSPPAQRRRHRPPASGVGGKRNRPDLLRRAIRVGGLTLRPIDIAFGVFLVAMVIVIVLAPPGWWM